MLSIVSLVLISILGIAICSFGTYYFIELFNHHVLAYLIVFCAGVFALISAFKNK